MSRRAGTSFVEVLVAAVLLAIGIVGCLSTIAAATRLRHGASVREELAARAHDRLAWFVARGCVVPDTAFASAPTALVEEQWGHTRTAVGARLTLHLSAPSSARRHTLSVAVALPCHG